MNADTQTLVVALIGGVGGALLTGIFTALSGAWADKRKQRSELDGWLRSQRFALIGELLDLINDSNLQASPGMRDEYASKIHDKYTRVMMVIPDSMRELTMQSVSHVSDELRGDFSERSVKSIAWQSAYLQRALTGGVKRLRTKLERLGIQNARWTPS